MLGAADAVVDGASDCILAYELEYAATSEAAEEVADTMLLDASAAADARAPMADDGIFAAPPSPAPPLLLPLDDERSGLGSMTLPLPPEEEERAAAAAVLVPATNFRRFFNGRRPRRHGLR